MSDLVGSRCSNCTAALVVVGASQVVAAQGTLKAIIAGAPASGKGTQCAKIVQEVGAVAARARTGVGIGQWR